MPNKVVPKGVATTLAHFYSPDDIHVLSMLRTIKVRIF
jgi:hypothetical protein